MYDNVKKDGLNRCKFEVEDVEKGVVLRWMLFVFVGGRIG